MLLDDRFVGTFGTVRAGDDSSIVRIAVEAVRRGFGVVPLQFNSEEPACALGVRDSKKPHDCHHILTVDTTTRAAFNRLTKDGARVNLGIDLATSNVGVTDNVDWWVGPEISPTMVMPDGTRLYVFDINGYEGMVPDLTTEGTLLVPPSALDDTNLVQLIGQINSLSDNVRPDNQEEAVTTVVNPDKDEYRMDPTIWQDTGRIEALEYRVNELGATVDKLKSALVVALTAMQEMKEQRSNG